MNIRLDDILIARTVRAIFGDMASGRERITPEQWDLRQTKIGVTCRAVRRLRAMNILCELDLSDNVVGIRAPRDVKWEPMTVEQLCKESFTRPMI